MGKKTFLNLALILCSMTITPAMMQSCTKQTYAPTNVNLTIDLTAHAYAALSTANGSVVDSGVVIIRTGASTYSALSNECTYQQCTVSYVAAYSEMICPCCSGAWDKNGNVISGPPPAALTKYTTTLNGHILTVKS